MALKIHHQLSIKKFKTWNSQVQAARKTFQAKVSLKPQLSKNA